MAHAWRANVHSFGHYLEHPAVHIPLLRALCGDDSVTAEEESKALKAAAERAGVVSESKESLQLRFDEGVKRAKDLFGSKGVL